MAIRSAVLVPSSSADGAKSNQVLQVFLLPLLLILIEHSLPSQTLYTCIFSALQAVCPGQLQKMLCGWHKEI